MQLKCHYCFIVISFLMCQYSKHTDEKGKFDELIEDKGVKILIDQKANTNLLSEPLWQSSPSRREKRLKEYTE